MEQIPFPVLFLACQLTWCPSQCHLLSSHPKCPESSGLSSPLLWSRTSNTNNANHWLSFYSARGLYTSYPSSVQCHAVDIIIILIVQSADKEAVAQRGKTTAQVTEVNKWQGLLVPHLCPFATQHHLQSQNSLSLLSVLMTFVPLALHRNHILSP